MTDATGWRLVPVEATEEMLSAAAKSDWLYKDDVASAIWSAMLSAAPQPGVTAEDLARVLVFAKTGADKAGCDGWRAQSMCRQIVQTLEPLSLISSNPTQKEQGA